MAVLFNIITAHFYCSVAGLKKKKKKFNRFVLYFAACKSNTYTLSINSTSTPLTILSRHNLCSCTFSSLDRISFCMCIALVISFILMAISFCNLNISASLLWFHRIGNLLKMFVINKITMAHGSFI